MASRKPPAKPVQPSPELSHHDPHTAIPHTSETTTAPDAALAARPSHAPQSPASAEKTPETAEQPQVSSADKFAQVLEKIIEPWAKNIKFIFQMLIGVGLVVHIFIQLLGDAGYYIIYPHDHFVQTSSPLELVAYALIFASAIELAYMLFTPGPDEAVAPLIMGIAAVVLFGAAKFDYSKPQESSEITRNMIILVLLIVVLFVIEKFFIQKKE